MQTEPQTIAFRLNGAEVRVTTRADEPLMYALRGTLGMTATRFGCGHEACGACVVMVGGAARFACTLPVADLEGAEVVTAEGLRDDPIGRALLAAFAEGRAGQCGYCLTGILMRAAVLLRDNPAPGRAEVAAALDGHLCRCGAHRDILAAIDRASAALGAA